MKKNLKSSILAATSLTALTVQHQTEANTLVFTEGQLSTLSNQNQLVSSDASVLDFSKMTPEIVAKLQGVTLDLSQFEKVNNIILPWFASKLNFTLPKNFGQPQNDVYSRLTLVNAGVAPSTESDLSLDLSSLLNIAGKITVDSKAVALKELISGSSAAKIVRNPETTQLTVSEKIEAIDTDGVIADGVKTSMTLLPSEYYQNQTKPLFSGLPPAVIGANPSTLDLSNYNIAGANVRLAGIKNIENLKVAQGDNIGTLTVTGETSFTTNAASIKTAEVTSETPVQSVVDTLAVVAASVAVQNSNAFKDSYKGSKDLDFSKVDFGSVDATASRIKDVITDSEIAPPCNYSNDEN